MDTRGLMDQLLSSGSSLLGKQGQGNTQSAAQGKDAVTGFLSGAGGGALAAGALGLLMGSKKARKVGGKVAMYGGLAALGAVAYKAYGNWQQGQGTAVSELKNIEQLNAPEAQAYSTAMLRALIGAAKADGHIDARERQLIDAEIARLSDDVELQTWFDQELGKPLDPAEIAAAANSPEMAAQMYLASALVIDDENFMERAYLQELARQLQLQPALVQELDAQARQSAVVS